MIRGFDNRVVKFLRFAALLPPTKACTLGMPLEHQVDLRPYPAHTRPARLQAMLVDLLEQLTRSLDSRGHRMT